MSKLVSQIRRYPQLTYPNTYVITSAQPDRHLFIIASIILIDERERRY